MEERASLLSRISFSWSEGVIKALNKDINVTLDQLPEAADKYTMSYMLKKIEKLPPTKDSRPHTLNYILFKLFFWRYFAIVLNIIFSYLTLFIGPILVKDALDFIKDQENKDLSEGIIIATIMFGSNFFRAIYHQHCMHRLEILMIQVLHVLRAASYQKVLKLAKDNKELREPGFINNLLFVDAESCYSFLNHGHHLFVCPVIISVSVLFIVKQVGMIGFVAPLMFLFQILVQRTIQKQVSAARKQVLKEFDKRGTLFLEILSGLKSIRINLWDKFFLNKIFKGRLKEEALLLRFGRLLTFDTMVLYIVSYGICNIMFYYLISEKHEFTSSQIYSILMLLNQLISPFKQFARTLSNLFNSNISLRRIQDFLNQSIEKAEYLEVVKNPRNAVEIEDCTFDLLSRVHATKSNESTKKPQTIEMTPLVENKQQNYLLTGINLTIKKNEFLAITGPVGSGKSILLSAIMGELNKISGQIRLSGSIGYCSQNPVILKGTIKENILFGYPYDDEKFWKVIRLCNLENDIQNLQFGVETQIGDQGTTISGGQRQRLAIARSLYSDPDILIFDDQLSSLDPKVSSEIFKNVFEKELYGKKTVICITSLKDKLCYFDRVIHIEDGRIKQSYENTSPLKQSTQTPSKIDVSDRYPVTNSAAKMRQDAKLAVKDNTEEVILKDLKMKYDPMDSFKKFFYPNGMTLELFNIFALLFVYQFLKYYSNFWLSSIRQENKSEWQIISPQYDPMLLYTLISFVSVVMTYFQNSIYRKFVFTRGDVLLRALMTKLTRGKLPWLLRCPNGLLTNRGIKDQNTIDLDLPGNIYFAVHFLIKISIILAINVFTSPIFLVMLAVLIPLCYNSVRKFFKASYALKKLQSVSRNSLFSHISQTINGIEIIRAFKKQDQFFEQFENQQNTLIRAVMYDNFCSRWVLVRMNILSSFIVGFMCYAGIFSKFLFTNHNPLIWGISITSSLQIMGLVSTGLSNLANSYGQLTSVQRIQELVECIPEEEKEESAKVASHKEDTKVQKDEDLDNQANYEELKEGRITVKS